MQRRPGQKNAPGKKSSSPHTSPVDKGSGSSYFVPLLIVGAVVGIGSVVFHLVQMPSPAAEKPLPSQPPVTDNASPSHEEHGFRDQRDADEQIDNQQQPPPPPVTESVQKSPGGEGSDADVAADSKRPEQRQEDPVMQVAEEQPEQMYTKESQDADAADGIPEQPSTHSQEPGTEADARIRNVPVSDELSQMIQEENSRGVVEENSLPEDVASQDQGTAEQQDQGHSQDADFQQMQSEPQQIQRTQEKQVDDQPVQQQEPPQQEKQQKAPEASEQAAVVDASVDEQPPLSEEDEKVEAAIRKYSEDANLTCDQWMDGARKLMMQGESSYSAALDSLAMCVFQEPNNSAAMWNMAVLLVKMNRTSEALVQMENAIKADPASKEFRHGAGTLLFKLQLYPQAAKSFEKYLELNLFSDDWQKLMEDIYWQREDELAFIKDGDNYDTMLMVMSKLLRCYLELRHLRQADRLYQVLITLEPHDHAMMENFATFSFGLGGLWNGVRFMKVYMEHQFYHSDMGTMEEAYEVMTAHMLRLATSGFDSNVVNLVRSLFIATDQAVEMVRESCGGHLLTSFNSNTHTLKQSELVLVLGSCIQDQQLIPSLVQAGASKVANNIFGWSSLLHGIHLGHLATVESMLEVGLDASHRTLLGMTGLHVAALRGYVELVPALLKAGVKVTDVDEYGRSPMDYVCGLRYPGANDFAKALGVPFDPKSCPTPAVKTGTSPLQSSAGEWLDTFRPLPDSLLSDTCAIDSVPADTSAGNIFRDYISMQKPVIIRHGLTNWAALKKKLQRRSLDRDYGSLFFKRSSVPYADTFGLESTATTLHDYLGYLSQLHMDEKKGTAPEYPDYVFSSISKDHPLRPLAQTPDALNPNDTHIAERAMQFYVGPALAGAPPHFHNFAWNGLVYGAKRWFIFPPRDSMYSKLPVLEWYKSYKSGTSLECTQHPGDVLVVPAMWAHAVINLKESVGFATEFIYGAAEFSI